MSIYGFETFLEFSTKTEIEILAKQAKKLGVSYDTRTKTEVRDSLRKKGIEALPNMHGYYWMEENGFLGERSKLGILATLLANRGTRDLVTVPAESKVTEVVGLLKLHGVSQLPVVDGDKLLGIISEKQLLERALEGERSNVEVGTLAQSNFCTVNANTDISVLTDLFRRFKVAIVLKDGMPTDIITRIDLIEHIGHLTGNGR